jgi:hypothetical protein
MNLSSLQLGQAFKLIMRTLPISLLRLGAYLVFWLITLVYLGIVGGLALLVGRAVPWLGVILFLVGLVGLGPIYRLIQRYVLYIIKAAHIAVLAELLARGDLPAGTGQLAWGKARVQERFGEASAMFVVDELVSAVVRGVTRAIYSVASWLPGETFRTIAGIANRIIHYAVSYVDEAILARAFWLDQGPVWATARDGVVLYGMVWKALLMNAVVLMALSYIPFILVLLILSGPVAALLSAISPQFALWSIVATLILGWLVKVAVGDTFAMAAIIATYYRETKELQPDPVVTAKLEGASDKFRTLQERATQELGKLGGSGRETAPLPTEPGV